MSRRLRLFGGGASDAGTCTGDATHTLRSEEERGRMKVLRAEVAGRNAVVELRGDDEELLATPISPMSSAGAYPASSFGELSTTLNDSDLRALAVCGGGGGGSGGTDATPLHASEFMDEDDDGLGLPFSPPPTLQAMLCDGSDDHAMSCDTSTDGSQDLSEDLLVDEPATSASQHLPLLDVDVEVSHADQVVRVPWLSSCPDDAPHLTSQSLEVPLPAWVRLYPHQREGVAWLWRQTCEAAAARPAGGILADEMGLGKTIQMLTFLGSALRCGFGKTAVIAVPPTVIASWQAHQETWCPRLRLITLTSDTPVALRSRIIEGFKNIETAAVLLTTYGMLQSMNKRDQPLNEVTWDYVVLDEGHVIKNPSSQTAKAAKALKSNVRFIITGTPIQNTLDELWSLYSFVDTRVLGGNAAAFKRTYTDPISKGLLKGATDATMAESDRLSARLRRCYEPYILQRSKDAIQNLGLTKKIDVVVWCGMSDLQRKVYGGYLEGADVKECLLKKEIPGAICMLTNLRKLCSHLWLQYSQEMLQNKLLCPDASTEQGTLVGDCCKMEVLLKIYDEARQAGQRLLVFSQSVKMLNIIQVVLRACYPDVQLLRLDGGTRTKDRQERVDRFNTDSSIDIMLITTGVGGTGLTLTGASRVVIFDPDWNPAKDSQAIGRAHRIGQTKQVVVYRLMTCGGVEELTYRQEIFKECVERKTNRNLAMHRYFNKVDLHAMFRFDPTETRTLDQLNTLQGEQEYPEDVRAVFHGLHDIPAVRGITDHDAVFAVRDVDEELDPLLPPARSLSGHSASSAASTQAMSDTGSSASQSPAPKRSALSDITADATPLSSNEVREALKPGEGSLDAYVSAPHLSPARETSCGASSCGEKPRDRDDEGLLRSAEEAFSRMQPPSPALGSLGLPPRHSSASKSHSPNIRPAVPAATACASCDYGHFPFCPATGKAHRKDGSAERADSLGRVHPPLIEAACDDDGSSKHCDDELMREASESSNGTMSSAPRAPMRRGHRGSSTPCSEMSFTQTRFSVGSGRQPQELFFGCRSTTHSVASSDSAPDAPFKMKGGGGGCPSDCDVMTPSTGRHGSLPRELSFGTHSVTVTEVSFSAAGPQAPGKPFRDAASFIADGGGCELSFSMGRSASGASAPEATLSFGGVRRELSMASVTSNTRYVAGGGGGGTGAADTPATLRFCTYSDGGRPSASPPMSFLVNAPERPLRDVSDPPVLPHAGSAQRELSFGTSQSQGRDSFATCKSSPVSGQWLNAHETPQATCQPQYMAPGAPDRNRAKGRSDSVGSAPFVSPSTRMGGVRRRITRCSESETSLSSLGHAHYYDDTEIVRGLSDRSVSVSTEDSLRIRNSVSLYTPPPL